MRCCSAYYVKVTVNFDRVLALKIVKHDFIFQLTPLIVFIWSSYYLYVVG